MEDHLENINEDNVQGIIKDRIDIKIGNIEVFLEDNMEDKRDDIIEGIKEENMEWRTLWMTTES